MKRTIAMLFTGVAIGFALALANADDTARSNSDVTVTQPGVAATATPGITPGIGTDMEGMNQPGQTGDTRTMEQSKEAMQTSKTCIDEAGVIHRAGTEAFTQCLKEKEKTHKEMGGEMDQDEMEQNEMSGESGEKSSDSGY